MQIRPASQARPATLYRVRPSLSEFSQRETGLQMEEIRCGACRKKLGEGVFAQLVIKCPRCGVLNHLRAKSPEPERHRASNPEGTLNGKYANRKATAGSASAR
jgi:phage FluMu protein Com